MNSEETFNVNDLQWFKKCLANKDLVEKLKKIKLIITDVDGCLTDGKIYYDENQNQMKTFSTVDGFGTVRSLEANLSIAFLSGRINNSTTSRAKSLKIREDMCFTGFDQSKRNKMAEIQKNNNISKDETLLFGDDFLDAECADMASIFACPPNTIFYIKNKSNLVLPKDGEHYPFRLIVDLILYIQEKHFAQNMITEAIQ